MRLTAQTRLTLSAGEEVFRRPSFWDKFKTFVGSDVDLRTGEISLAQNALALTEQVQQAFKLAKITNAVSLAVDTDIVYQDLHDKADDADLLLEAARRHASRFTQPFDIIRIVFEWQGSGLEVLIEAIVRSKFKPGEPAVILSYGARISALRPADGEDTDKAKARIGQELSDVNLVPVAKTTLDSLVGRVEGALSRMFVAAQVETDHADVNVRKPSGQEVRDMAGNWQNHNADLRSTPSWGGSGGWNTRYYDPWSTYYYDPMDTFVNMMVIDAIMHPHHHHWGWDPGYLGSSWSAYGAPVTFVDYHGHVYGTADHYTDFHHHFNDVGSVSQNDFSSASWDDSALSSYDANQSSFDSYATPDAGGGTWDCADGTASAATDSATGSSADCSFDCAAADCSWDCSSDCASDCSSDCSSDCGGSD
ncbi:MAG: hypothetical protein EXR77_14310 [Myxococcales bacterium]|nr:hypothetical protein [Myxococcales bacterium]